MTRSNDSLLVVAGHAIWENNAWCGIESSRFSGGIVASIESQIKAGYDFIESGQYDVLAFSGGHSRPDNDPPLANSEAKGMQIFATKNGWIPKSDVILEEFARDSFENIFYSLLAFHKKYNKWPSRLGVISMPHKSIRYMLMATGLKIEPTHFAFYGIGAVTPLDRNCVNEMANMTMVVDSTKKAEKPMDAIVDPLLRAEYFDKKRTGRTQRTTTDYVGDVKAAYGNDTLIDQVTNCSVGLAWQTLSWPWQKTP